jgi:hypothetical protein
MNTHLLDSLYAMDTKSYHPNKGGIEKREIVSFGVHCVALSRCRLFFDERGFTIMKTPSHENDNQIQRRYWDAFRIAIEEYNLAVERNENGFLIHGLARVVRLREQDLDKVLDRKVA